MTSLFCQSRFLYVQFDNPDFNPILSSGTQKYGGMENTNLSKPSSYVFSLPLNLTY